MEKRTHTYCMKDSRFHDDATVLIEEKRAQISPMSDNYYMPLQLVKTEKQPLFKFLDIALSSFIIGPCIVGVWRGTWQIMEIYLADFSNEVSFVLAVSIILGSIVAQNIFDYVFDGKNSSRTERWATFVFIRCYIYTLNVIGILQWKSGWNIIDHYFGVVMKPSMVVSNETSPTFWLACGIVFVLVITMKCVLNCVGAPFVVALDRKDQVFSIPTMFKQQILYTVLSLTKGVHLIKNPAGLNTEKLILTETDKFEDIPEHFGIVNNNPPPTEFSSTTPKVKALQFPQLSTYRKKYPKNIQDIIGYVTKDRSNLKLGRNFNEHKTESKNRTFTSSDPFYPFKPQDPGDINLLATASFRFAPPVWQHSNVPKNYQETNRREVYKMPPLMINLNIYPAEKDFQSLQKFVTESNDKNENFEKMVINFNIYSKPELDLQVSKPCARIKRG